MSKPDPNISLGVTCLLIAAAFALILWSLSGFPAIGK